MFWDGSSSNQGGVYIFDRSGDSWVQRGAVLTASDAGAGDGFGLFLDLSYDGDVLIVGVIYWDASFGDQGGVYIFDRSGDSWVQRGSVLTAPDPGGDRFGNGVGLSDDGNVLVVAARYWDGSVSNQGGVYIFDRSGGSWVQRGAVLTAADPVADGFASALALSGDGEVLAVGGFKWGGHGAVYVFDRSGDSWVQRGAVLTASDAGSGDGFGVYMTLSDDGGILVVGANEWDGALSGQGAVYVFDRSGDSWVQRGAVLTASDAGAGDGFGLGVSISGDGNVLAVGAMDWSQTASQQGVVYTYDSTL
jgi:hypothetical protein